MSMKDAKLCIAALLVLVACFAAACGGSTETTKPSPTQPSAPDGAALVNERCVVCHSLDRVTQSRKAVAEWETTVTRMRGHGAKLTDTEAQVVVQYLAKTYEK